MLEATKTTWKRVWFGHRPVGGEDAAARVGALFDEAEHHDSQGERLVT